MTEFAHFHPGRLPLFRAELEGSIVLYAPGHIAVVTRDEAETIEHAFATERFQEGIACLKVAAELEECARRVVIESQQRLEATFAPECLTVYLGNQCNLACPYCYTVPHTPITGSVLPPYSPICSSFSKACRSKRNTSPAIDERVVRAAARLVAQFCAEKGEPFHIVLHGGGEPTVHWNLVQQIEATTRQISDEFGLDWFGYIATNGVMPAERARWLAEHFDLIGLSCDGPLDIQDQQRPLRNGGGSSLFMRRTAQVLVASGGSFDVRTTITPQTVERQSEIAVYLHEQLGATQMRFEPVYLQHSGQEGFIPEDADRFVQHFLAAQRTALDLGCELKFSGVRLDEVHGPYCNVLRDVLNLTPDGAATACFARCCGDELDAAPFMIGRMDETTGEFIIDYERVAELRHLLAAVPDRCRGCINAYHCARGCPETCPVRTEQEGNQAFGKGLSKKGRDQDQTPGFRCLVNRKLAETWVLEAVQSVKRIEHRAGSKKPAKTTDDGARLEDLLADAPPEINVETVRHQWQAIEPLFRTVKRSLPMPVWARRGFTHSGPAAWRMLRQELETIEPRKALSIYIHIPFCHHKCAFCDCYSRVLSRRNRDIEEEYERVLLGEMDFWSPVGTLAERPVTTVHFGGGTPNHLSPRVLTQVVEHCATRFGVTSQTEWALESTSSLLTDEHLERLRSLGFKRSHVGVQTLEDQVRKLIGRRGNAGQVLQNLARSLEMGFIVSVDIIYGLPRESLSGFVAGLKRLMDIEVHGFSLYQLQIGSQNKRFLERQGIAECDPVRNYAFLQVAEQLLTLNGYRKTYFNHFAKPEDRNLYYSFPERGEDLLALGTVADGVFGDYHYRHPEYHDYVSSPSQKLEQKSGAGAMQDMPSLEGGVRETNAERMVLPAAIELLAGYITRMMLRKLKADWVLEGWLEHAFLESSFDDRCFTLTANGSWLIAYMLQQLSEAVAASDIS